MWRRRLRLLLLLMIMIIALSSFPLSRGGAAPADCHTVSISAASLDSIIRGHAFDAVAQRRSGVVYRVLLPAELSGIEAAAVKLRGSSFWRDGVNVNSFQIPKKTFTVPYARRILLVYQNLGNWSSCYYNVRSYSPATPVVGLLAYDDFRNATARLELRVGTGAPISVAFPYVRLPPEGLNSSSVRCARFGTGTGAGAVEELRDAHGWHGCSATNAGHFVMVFPSTEVTLSLPPPPPPSSTTPLLPEEEGRKWPVWLIACGCGVVGGVALVLVAVGIAELVKRRRLREMERNSEEGVVLDSMWVRGSMMPSASMMRTRPVLEEDGSSP